jgi:hypothetical protein
VRPSCQLLWFSGLPCVESGTRHAPGAEEVAGRPAERDVDVVPRADQRRGACGDRLPCGRQDVVRQQQPVAAVRAAAVEDPAEVRLRRARTLALRRLARTEAALPAGRFPTVATDGRWRTEGPWAGWLAGFHPGELWTAYEMTGRPAWARLAARRQRALAPRAADTASHDLGFLLQTGFGRGVRLRGRTADAAVLDRAAASLAARWVPAAHALRSWDGPPGEVT